MSEVLRVALKEWVREGARPGLGRRAPSHAPGPSIPLQVGCLPWTWSSSPNGSLVVLSSGGRAPMLPAPPCESAPHALLCGLVGTLPLVTFLRVSSLPKMILLAVLTTSYILVLELSGYTKAVG